MISLLSSSKQTSIGVGCETISNTGDLFCAVLPILVVFSFGVSALILNVAFIFS
ncbi:MAG TPA: hypothetical protein VF084_07880 [Nitrososphaeraceae archaeon]